MNDSRENDLRMLHEALALPKIEDAARDAFVDMLESLGVRRQVRHNHGPLAECRAQCPAWVPPTLRELPKRPPRRAS